MRGLMRVVIFTLLSLAALYAQAQAVYPTREVKLVAGFAGFDVQGDYFMVAPAKTPQAIQMTLAKAVDEISHQTDTIAFIEGMHARPLYGGPKETKAFLEGEYTKWKTLIDAVGIKVD
jgi:tripartite-type tricarboxylate transporter receptor subunit TctC